MLYYNPKIIFLLIHNLDNGVIPMTSLLLPIAVYFLEWTAGNDSLILVLVSI